MGSKIVARYLRATGDMRVLEPVVDTTVDRFINLLVDEDPLSEKKVSHVLQEVGVTPDMVNSSDPHNKEAGESLVALGGLVRKALWYVLIRPFKLVAKILTSSSFRQGLKKTVWKALSRDAEATRRLVEVFGKHLSGEPIRPRELQLAKKQLVSLIARAALLYFAGPQLLGAFGGPIWTTVGKLAAPVTEILGTLFVAPINAVSRRLMTEDLG